MGKLVGVAGGMSARLHVKGLEVIEDAGRAQIADHIECIGADPGSVGQVALGESAGGQPGQVERALSHPAGWCLGERLVEADDGVVAVFRVGAAERTEDASDVGVQRPSIEEADELGIVIGIDMGVLVFGPPERGKSLALIGEVGVSESGVGVQERERGGGTGILCGDLAELEQLQRFGGVAVVQWHTAEMVQDDGGVGVVVGVAGMSDGLCEVATCLVSEPEVVRGPACQRLQIGYGGKQRGPDTIGSGC
ncbi:hypothetical protein UA74_04290 [Actinoalloteichus fjordicus]|uniref:Uncharacterized protein n=1 Tax=Actinoalloteichus fjordicus TaxID=1612552 RepID=A0AAC9PQH8_9PSEU|nr:hypothetical protein UA74_04290 [Actinoalloteichus fjordicus]